MEIDTPFRIASATILLHAAGVAAFVSVIRMRRRRPTRGGAARGSPGSPTPWSAWMTGILPLGPLAAGALLLGEDIYGSLRLLCWVLFFWTPLALLLVARWQRVDGSSGRLRRHRRTALGVAAMLILAATQAFLIEPRWLEVTHHEIEISGLERSLRVAVLADIQTDRFDRHTRRAIAAARDVRPDLVLLPGDYVQTADRDRRARVGRQIGEALDALVDVAPLGVHAVGGNSDSGDWPRIFEGTRVTVYRESETRVLGDLRLTALDWRDSFTRDGRPLWPVESAQGPHLVLPHLILGHAPDFALESRGYDLAVAGHVHGGQVRLPWIGPLVTFSAVPRRLAVGLSELDDRRRLYVSRGIGMERVHAPRLRFFCRPEVAILELVPTPELGDRSSGRQGAKRP